MEAAACGLPIITTNIPACAEAVDEGANGWILDRKDSGVLAEIMAEASVGVDARLKMAAESRKRAERFFSQEAATRATVEVYRQHFPNLTLSS
jgi:glycosyltransferase involved in cell wall biosynthesis